MIHPNTGRMGPFIKFFAFFIVLADLRKEQGLGLLISSKQSYLGFPEARTLISEHK